MPLPTCEMGIAGSTTYDRAGQELDGARSSASYDGKLPEPPISRRYFKATVPVLPVGTSFVHEVDGKELKLKVPADLPNGEKRFFTVAPPADAQKGKYFEHKIDGFKLQLKLPYDIEKSDSVPTKSGLIPWKEREFTYIALFSDSIRFRVTFAAGPNSAAGT